MRKQFYFLLLSVLLSIPLGMKATIVDDTGVFNFSPFYDPSSGVIGLSLTFFPSEEGDTVYIPDYIYENNQYKYVVCINTGAFFDCNAKYIRLPNHVNFRVSSNATASYCTGVSNNYIIQKTNATVIPANVGVCVKCNSGNFIDVIATTSSCDSYTSILVPVLSDANIPASSNGLYNYYCNGEDSFIKISNSKLIKANNAYLTTIINHNPLTYE